MSNDNTAIFQAHVQATINLLIGTKKMRPGLMVCAGDPLGIEQRLGLAQTAVAHQTDVVHLQFSSMATGCYFTGLTVIVPREDVCLVATECRLYLAPGSSRALIVPGNDVCGHFAAIPGEILHRHGKPKDLDKGAQRAATRLSQITRVARPLRGDVDITIFERGG